MTALHDLPLPDTALHDTALPDTLPRRGHWFSAGQRVTDVFDTSAGLRRYIGTVVPADHNTFYVDWDSGQRARYVHDHEPDTLRHALPEDEQAARLDRRSLVAAELRRLLRDHPDWPVAVRTTLAARATQITGGAR